MKMFPLAVATLLAIPGSSFASTYTKTINVGACRSIPDSGYDWSTIAANGDSVSDPPAAGGTHAHSLVCDLGLPVGTTQLDSVSLEYSRTSATMASLVIDAYRTWVQGSFLVGTAVHQNSHDGTCTAGTSTSGHINRCSMTLNVSMSATITPQTDFYAAYVVISLTEAELSTPGATAYRVQVTYDAP